jgi:glycosyltransferase involved in cell wall biosynthesis
MASPIVGEFSEWCASQDVKTYQLPLPPPSKLNPFPFAKSLWSLAQIVYHHRIRIVHCNEQDVYPIGSYVARLMRIPVVVSIHFTMERDYCKWAFAGSRRPSRIFFTSRGNLDACSAAVAGIIEEHRWRILNNGINMEWYKPDSGLRESFRQRLQVGESPLIGIACALRPRKQLEHLFEAAASVVQNPFVIVAGAPVSGDEKYADALMQRGKELLGDRLITLGHVDDLRAFYNALDLFVNTSQEEACSLSILECMSSGCPVVGYASKTVHTQILPEGGEIVPQDDLNSLRVAIESWLGDSERLALGRLGARKRIRDEFSAPSAARQLWSEYASVLKGTAA